MYGVDKSVKRVNYYVPVQDDAPPCKKKKCESVPRHAACILGRRYALTSCKYLEIGISVGLVSTVELVLGDNRGNRLFLQMPTWGGLMTKRDDILQLFHATETSSSALWIRDLLVERCAMYNTQLIKLTLSDTCMYFKLATIEYLFTLEHCVEHMYSWLYENTHIVNAKFRKFVNLLCEKNITDVCYAATAIRESEDFDSGSLIDCELLACALNDIMYEVLNK